MYEAELSDCRTVAVLKDAMVEDEGRVGSDQL
jgi:hypothetical protein